MHDAADFVGDGVEAPALHRRTRVGVGDPALLLKLDGFGRAGDGGMALMLHTDVSGAVVVRGASCSAPIWFSHHGYCGAILTGCRSLTAILRCAFNEVAAVAPQLR